MITKELALTLRHGQVLHHSTGKNADGTPLRCRVNGYCKTWKRTPEAFKLPVKHGLRDCFYITENEAQYWSLPERHPVEQHWK